MDREKVRQALQEWKYAFVGLVAPLFVALANGIQVGDGKDEVTVFPDLNALKALVAAMSAAAALSFVKALLWYFTGTKVRGRA